MSGWSRPRNWGVALMCGVALASSVFAQNSGRRAKVTQMEILNGTQRTVRYFGDNISPGEASTLREVERLENERSYLNNLQALKDQYVVSERLLETNRRLVQLQQYGVESTRTSYGTVSAMSGFGGYGYPYMLGYGINNNGGVAALAGESETVTRTLADGVGPEGQIKAAMAQVLAQQSTEEYASKVNRAYDLAMLRASTSPTLRAALTLPNTEAVQREQSRIRLASGESAPPATVIVTLQDGEKIYGRKISEKGDFLVIDTANGSEEIRKSLVVRIQRGKSNGVVPAVDP